MLYLFTEALLFYIQGVSLAPPISASTQAVLLWLSPRLDEWCYAQTLSGITAMFGGSEAAPEDR